MPVSIHTHTSWPMLDYWESLRFPATTFCFMFLFAFLVILHAFYEFDVEITHKWLHSSEKGRFDYYFLHTLLPCNKYFWSFIINNCYMVAGWVTNKLRWMHSKKNSMENKNYFTLKLRTSLYEIFTILFKWFSFKNIFLNMPKMIFVLVFTWKYFKKTLKYWMLKES